MIKEPIDRTNEDLKDLQKRTLSPVIIGVAIVFGVVLYWNVVLFATNSEVEPLLIVANVILGLTVWVSYFLYKRNQIDYAAIILIAGAIISVDLTLLLPNALTSFYPYLFLFIIALSGLIITPAASLNTALISIISAGLVVGLSSNFNTTLLKMLIAPVILALLIALVTWGGASNLTTTFAWVLQSQRKARRRRDELFESRQELKKAYELLESTNYRLQEAQATSEQRAEELAQLNTKLMRSEEELRKLVASKDKFFSIISHDLKNPFHALMGFSEFLLLSLDVSSKRDIKDMVNNIHISAKSTYNLLENLLEWSRMQTGRMPHKPQKIEISVLVNETITLLSGNAKAKNINLCSDIKRDYLVFADINMINSVIQNLTTNALKFTPNGGQVKISVDHADDNDLVEISVTDTGVGIAPEDAEKLFRIDMHHSTEGTDKEGGTGLGLILCKEMVEKNGGQIWIKSAVGEGTKISFTLQKVHSTEKLK